MQGAIGESRSLDRDNTLKKTPKNGLFRRQILVSPQFGIVDQTPLWRKSG